ncbi:MAG: nitrite/sulfite reductase, partial [Rhodospirillaceae bacterium]|nr:nitrite/sulfite reductase [Rhodospirillaceae bacterium]
MSTQTTPYRYISPAPDALVSSTDLEEFKSGLANYKAGNWHEDRWKTFRLRFGIYEQRQKGQHMVRIKVPGGRLSIQQAHTIAKANASHAGGSVHITTRQAIQLYFVDLDKLYDLLVELNLGGVTTREASGGTFRNITACALSGNCVNANTNAVEVAENLARAWLRNPLVQHMPRKVKTAVSGCELDCGLTAIDDLGFIATNKNGNSGFRVVAGGGLGTHPRTAVNIIDFISEHDLPVIQEAVARIHHRYSNRENKNKSRLKFLVEKFGADKFSQLIRDEFEKIKPLPRSPWKKLAWRGDEATVSPKRLLGSVNHSDGSISVGIDVPLGILSPEQLDEITYLTKTSGGNELILTRNQNVVVTGLNSTTTDAFIKGINHIALDASGREHPLDDLVSCFGSSTCAIGITDAN